MAEVGNAHLVQKGYISLSTNVIVKVFPAIVLVLGVEEGSTLGEEVRKRRKWVGKECLDYWQEQRNPIKGQWNTVLEKYAWAKKWKSLYAIWKNLDNVSMKVLERDC